MVLAVLVPSGDRSTSPCAGFSELKSSNVNRTASDQGLHPLNLIRELLWNMVRNDISLLDTLVFFFFFFFFLFFFFCFFFAGPKNWGEGVHSASIDYTIQSLKKIAPLPNTLEYIGIDFQVNLLCIMYVHYPAYHVCWNLYVCSWAIRLNASINYLLTYLYFLILCDHSAHSGIFENLYKGLAALCYDVDMALQVPFEKYMVIIGHSS